jgi:hypothetical protein
LDEGVEIHIDVDKVSDSMSVVDESVREGQPISTLWSTLAADEVKELLDYGGNPSDIEKMHGVVQQKRRCIPQNSGVYKPDKVFIHTALINCT